MADDPLFNNIVIFRASDGLALFLRMDGEWTWEAGIKPSVFSAIAAYGEFAKLGQDLERYGQLEFYFEGKPENGEAAADLVLKNWTLVDVQAGNYQRVEAVGQTPARLTHIEYRLAFADARDAFSGFRGGALDQGEINTEPLSKDGNKDANGAKVLTVRELVGLCIKALGISCKLAQELSDAPFALNLDWRGNSAAEELERLVTDAGFVFVVKNDGSFAIEQLGKGNAPFAPAERTVLDAPYPGIDRRGHAVVFSSAPLAVVNTATYNLEDLEWVMLDKEAGATNDVEAWVTLDKSAALKGLDPIEVIKQDYEPVKETYRQRVSNFLYAALRLNADKNGPQPMVRFRYDTAAAHSEISVMAKTLTIAPTGLAAMSDDLIDIPPTAIMGGGTVLILPSFLGKLKDDKVVGNIHSDFKPLEKKELILRLTREVYDPNDDGTWRPRFYRVGYKQELGSIKRMSEKEIDTFLADGRTGYIPAPQLRLYQTNGEDQNRKQLESIAAGMAFRYIGGSGNEPRITSVAGYVPADLSGKVQQITFRPSPPMTTWKGNSWYMPHEARPVLRVLKTGKGGGGKFPQAAETADRRTAEGIAGGQQPSVILNPRLVPPAAPQVILGKLIADSQGGAKYYIQPVSGKCTATATGNLAWPEGMTIDTDPANEVLVLNTEEAQTHWVLSGSSANHFVMCLIIGVGGDKKRIGVINQANPFGAFPVTLVQQTGSDGNETTEPSYGYRVFNLRGQILGEGMQPEERPGGIGSFTAAGKGLGYYDSDSPRRFHLLRAYEKRRGEPCPTP